MDNIEKRSLDILEHFVFNNTTFKVEILWENGDPLFKAKDIANVLGIKNVHASLADYDSDEKVLGKSDTLGGVQDAVFLTDIGMYRLVFQSRKPIAKPFQKWVAKVVREIEKNWIYEVEDLKKELEKANEKNVESIRKSDHDALLKVYDKKHVVYFARIRELNGKILVKIGSTKDIKTTFTERHPKDYGNILVFHAIECKTNRDFEYFLLHHKDISKFLYKSPVKIGGGKSNEVILVTEEELQKVLRIAVRNTRNYPNAAPNIDSRIDELESKLDKIVNLIDKTSNVENTTDQSSEEPLEEKPEETSEEEKEVKEKKKKASKRIRKKGTGKCSECDTDISDRAVKCVECHKKGKKFEITKKELINLVWIQKLPYTEIGAKYGVSDNAIRKRCRTLGVKIRTR